MLHLKLSLIYLSMNFIHISNPSLEEKVCQFRSLLNKANLKMKLDEQRGDMTSTLNIMTLARIVSVVNIT